MFLAFCRPRGLLPLPASPSTVAAFIEACAGVGKKPATVRQCNADFWAEGRGVISSIKAVGENWSGLVAIENSALRQALKSQQAFVCR